jgi:hypothetical protein
MWHYDGASLITLDAYLGSYLAPYYCVIRKQTETLYTYFREYKTRTIFP